MCTSFMIKVTRWMTTCTSISTCTCMFSPGISAVLEWREKSVIFVGREAGGGGYSEVCEFKQQH